MKCRFQFFIRWTGFCNHIILMYEISVMLIFNNHLQCLQTNNCILPMEKIDESNDKAELTFLQNALSKPNWAVSSLTNGPKNLVLEANFGVPWYNLLQTGFVDQSIEPSQYIWKNKEKLSSTSSRTLRAAARILACWSRWFCFIRFSITDISEWNCSNLAGSIFAKSCETLLNLAKFNKKMNLNIVG